jgi:hypothetical protein
MSEQATASELIRSVLYLEPRGGDYAPLVEFFKTAAVLERSLQKGSCLAADIQVPVTRKGPLLVTALWTSTDGYKSWVDDPWRATNHLALSELLTAAGGEQVRGDLYEIEHAVSLQRGSTI